jgi:hypothetical protein
MIVSRAGIRARCGRQQKPLSGSAFPGVACGMRHQARVAPRARGGRHRGSTCRCRRRHDTRPRSNGRGVGGVVGYRGTSTHARAAIVFGRSPTDGGHAACAACAGAGESSRVAGGSPRHMHAQGHARSQNVACRHVAARTRCRTPWTPWTPWTPFAPRTACGGGGLAHAHPQPRPLADSTTLQRQAAHARKRRAGYCRPGAAAWSRRREARRRRRTSRVRATSPKRIPGNQGKIKWRLVEPCVHTCCGRARRRATQKPDM